MKESKEYMGRRTLEGYDPENRDMLFWTDNIIYCLIPEIDEEQDEDTIIPFNGGRFCIIFNRTEIDTCVLIKVKQNMNLDI